jgi:hypothetical protein
LKLKIALFVFSVLVLGCVLLWRDNADPFHLSAYVNRPRATPAVVPDAVPSPPAKPASKPVAARVVKPAVVETPPAPVIAEASPKPVVPVRAPAPPVDPPPFPQVDQIASGASANMVIDKYGAPAISALTSDRGHVLNTYIYAKDRGRSETVIQLEDGKVASAFAKSMPAPPSGILVPRP